ncbi:helix-turn-helix transcriptional regulator [Saccharothrix deserti]|uniref:helix-turn-helix transcriptional regulator n=1 Tax=Saccharothrix deserti TaxID=2593674 RepID=UPI00131C4C1D|nr:LuxR family transcriptional regulator [Saccharothrix deserti]
MAERRSAVVGAPVGRDAAVAAIRARVEEIVSGEPGGALLLSGPVGIGRSTVIERARDALRDDVTVAHACCVPGAPQFAALRHLLGSRADELLPPPPEEARPDDYALLYRLYRHVVVLAAERPVVLLVDDAHYCDLATARWLDFLLRRVAGLPVLVVLALPHGEHGVGDVRFTDLDEAIHTTLVRLAPLGEGEIAEFVARELGIEPDDEFLAVCMEVTGGNAAMMRALLIRLRDDGLGSEDPEPGAHAADRAHRVASEWAITCMVTWLEKQSEPIRQYATGVALLDTAASPEVIAALFGMSTAVASAARATLVYFRALAPNGVEFRADYLRDSLLGALDPAETAALRVRAARLLADLGRPDEEIARQLVAVPAPAEPWMLSALSGAARSAASAGSPEVAVEYLRRVLDAAPDQVDTRVELAMALAQTDPGAALTAFTEALAGIADPVVKASLAVRYAMVALGARRSAQAISVVLDALDGLPADADTDLRVLVDLTALVLGFGNLGTTAQAVARGRATAAPSGRTTSERRLAHQLARTEMLSGGSSHRALELIALGANRRIEPYDWWDVYPSIVLHFAGDPGAALSRLDTALTDTSRRGDAWSHYLTLVARAALRLDAGELTDAEADAEHALGVVEAAGWTVNDAWARTVVDAARVNRNAGAAAEPPDVGAEPRSVLEYGAEMIALARRRVIRLDHEGALEVLLRCGRELDAMSVRNPVLVPWWLDATTLLADLGRPAEAVDLVERGAERAARWDTPTARGYALLAEGLITSGRARVEVLEAAVGELTGTGALLREVGARTALGHAFLAEGRGKPARRHFRAAVDLAVRCGDLPAAAVARSGLMRAGGRMPGLTATPANMLTGSERRVAALAAEGRTNREIAAALFVTVRTVESHLSNAYRKLGVQTRTDLVGHLG